MAMRPVTGEDFIGLMGQTEMECALVVIVNKAYKATSGLRDVRFTVNDFGTPDSYEYDGFWSLKEHGWLEYDMAADLHMMSRDLVLRVENRIKSLGL